MGEQMNEQQKLNQRARTVGAKITIAQGWDVQSKDGTVYRVTTAKELNELVAQLEKIEKENVNS